MVRRAGGRAEGFHLGRQKIDEGVRVEHGLGFLIKVRLVGRAAALGDKQKFVGISRNGIQVDLRRQVASGVLLVVHGEGRILRVPQARLGIGVENPPGQRLRLVEIRPDLLAFFSHDDGGSGVLAERKFHLGGDDGVFQHLEGDEFIVFRSLGIVKNGRHLLEMTGAKEVGNISEGLFGQKGQRLGCNDEHVLARKG